MPDEQVMVTDYWTSACAHDVGNVVPVTHPDGEAPTVLCGTCNVPYTETVGP